MARRGWVETEGAAGDGWLFSPGAGVAGAVVVFSGRGAAPEGTASPTEFLARRLACAAGVGEIPIVRATQVHGRDAAIIREPPPAGGALYAGPRDVLATALPNVALVVQTADCVPILFRAGEAIAAAHAGWRGTAAGAAGAALDALEELGARPADVEAWVGPSIGSCCYEVGGEVASQFAGEFVRRDCKGKFRLDLAAVNRAELESRGVRPDAISIHPACTQCGGQRYASYRRDGAAAGRMIAMIAKIDRGIVP
jgi:YfiH family protein